MAPPDKQAAAMMMMLLLLLLYYISVILSVQAKTSPAEEEKIFSCINIRKILQCSILLLQFNSSTLGLRKQSPLCFYRMWSTKGGGACLQAANFVSELLNRRIRCLPQHNTLQNMNCYGFQARQKCRFSELQETKKREKKGR